MVIRPLFFASASGEALFGVYRCAENQAPRRVWVLCPPFAEEDKSARRALTEVSEALVAGGDATLLFAYRGTGDSEGDFATVSLEDWRADIASAAGQARILSDAGQLGLLGVRLGASLALQLAGEVGADQLLLVEPLLSGRSFLMQQSLRRKMRSELTAGDQAEEIGLAVAPAAPEGESQSESQGAPQGGDWEDLDGWALGPLLKADLNQLDLKKAPPAVPSGSHLFQVGPKHEVSPPLAALGAALGVPVQAVVMPPFWNLLDYASPRPLVDAILACLADGVLEGRRG